MAETPVRCPRCGKNFTMRPDGESKGGVSVGKAAVGGLLLGPIGLLAGALGKKKTIFVCINCGYTIEK